MPFYAEVILVKFVSPFPGSSRSCLSFFELKLSPHGCLLMICFAGQIDVKNPREIISQDKSREFLHSGNAEDKFKVIFAVLCIFRELVYECNTDSWLPKFFSRPHFFCKCKDWDIERSYTSLPSEN
jgi:hypothetical protein